MPQPGPETLSLMLIVLPLGAAAVAFLLGPLARPLALLTAGLVLASAVALSLAVMEHGGVRYPIGGWGAPLGIDLRADGLAAFMVLLTAVAGVGVGVYGRWYFPLEPVSGGGFWPLWLLLWAALNALYLSGDLFNLYVTLELVGLAAVALVALADTREALGGAMRYLLTTMAASLTYLLGVGILYHHAGVLDLVLLGERLDAAAPARIALGLMVAALVVKTALFPLHFWLPAAHASAPAPVSALLSGLVVKATLYLLVRLWIDLVPPGAQALGTGLAALGTGAIVWGSLQALRQQELKLLVAYSTVAQLGYLFLPFALGAGPLAAAAWRGAWYFALCHALAKAAMFMAVGNLARFGGSGRLDTLRDLAPWYPLTLAAFGVAGITLVGLPPSGGFVGKWLMLEAAVGARSGWLVVVILAGGLLSAAYVLKVVGLAFTTGRREHPRPERAPAVMEWLPLLLALATLLLGFTAPPLLGLLDAGRPLAPAAADGAGP